MKNREEEYKHFVWSYESNTHKKQPEELKQFPRETGIESGGSSGQGPAGFLKP